MSTVLPDKKSIANQFKLLASYLTLQEEDIRAKAYERAARALENTTDDLNTLHAEGKMHSIRGIGKGIAEEIAQLVNVDVLPSLTTVAEQIPSGVRDLFKVNGLGAKKIKQLWANGIDSLDKVIQVAEDGELEQMKGFGKKSSATILFNARYALSTLSGLRLDEAENLAIEMLHWLKEYVPSAKVDITGQLRRVCETVETSEFIAVHPEPIAWLTKLQNILLQERGLEGILEDQQLHFTVERHPVIIHCCLPEAATPYRLYRSSDATHWHFLQHHAAEQGYILATDALNDPQGQPVSVTDEEAIYTTLKLDVCPPERRETTSPTDINTLIGIEHMRGLVHNHSNWSDGAHSLEEMIEAARERDVAYLAMADHSRSSVVANGLSIERVYAQAEALNALKMDYNDIELLHGIEVDILKDGTLDYPDDVLASLDYCVVSVHQNFTLSETEQTERIIKAVSHPYADILAHPTGRILLRRPSYALDVRAVIDACAHYGTVIELNASPYRLDISWKWLEYALEQGCDIAINPDAHSTRGYDVVRYGVMMARKAGVPVDRVVNTADTAQAFLARLKRSTKRS